MSRRYWSFPAIALGAGCTAAVELRPSKLLAPHLLIDIRISNPSRVQTRHHQVLWVDGSIRLQDSEIRRICELARKAGAPAPAPAVLRGEEAVAA